MPKLSKPRHGSLQFWPRKRVRRALHRVNWNPVHNNSKINGEGFLGLIGYKVGMSRALVKDNTDKSMTKGRKITIPVTILEVPNMKIFSVRFYKKEKVMTEVVVSNDKELKKILKTPKEIRKIDNVEGYDDIRIIVYSITKQTGIKKSPDIIELAVKSSDKISFIKKYIGKEISLSDNLNYNLVDIRGLTKGKGNQGPVKRFGIKLRAHKSEKGIRKPGSIGPWHPARVTFRVPMAGQLGMFSRTHYNLKVLDSGNVKQEGKDINLRGGIKNYGVIKTNYVILAGSVQGPQKRQLLITPAMRPTKKTSKKSYELISLEGRR